MLSQNQANLIADKLLEREAQKLDQDRNRHSLPVPLFYRFSELSFVQPWQRQQIVRTAVKLAGKRLPVLLAGFIWVSSILGYAFFVPQEYQAIHSGLSTVTFVGEVPFILIHRHFTHQYVVALCHKLSAIK